jgi:amino acid permease
LLAAIRLLLPAPVEKARLKLDIALGKSFLLGLVNMMFFSAIAALLVWLTQLTRSQSFGIAPFLAAVMAVLALAILVTTVVFALNGVVAMASLFGSRLDKTKSPFMSDLYGGLLLVLACLTPYIGWYLFTPVVISMGLGASILALFQKKPLVAAE